MIPINITVWMTDPLTNQTAVDSEILYINIVFSDLVVISNSTQNSTGYI